MGLETVNFLPDFNIDNPTPTDPKSEGDDHIRNLKKGLVGDGTSGSGSFTPGFTGQYTGTADDLMEAGASVIDDLADVDTTSTAPTEGDGLIFQGGLWVPGGAVFEYLHYNFVGVGTVNNQRVLLGGTSEIDTITGSGLATVINSSGDAFSIVALTDCRVDFSISTDTPQTQPVWIAVSVNGDGAGAIIPTNQPGGVLRARGPQNTLGSGSCSVLLVENQEVWINVVETGFNPGADSAVQILIEGA